MSSPWEDRVLITLEEQILPIIRKQYEIIQLEPIIPPQPHANQPQEIVQHPLEGQTRHHNCHFGEPTKRCLGKSLKELQNRSHILVIPKIDRVQEMDTEPGGVGILGPADLADEGVFHHSDATLGDGVPVLQAVIMYVLGGPFAVAGADEPRDALVALVADTTGLHDDWCDNCLN
jgi:hypothetical protein